jgi:iron(III) transport system substrate-binding protein
MSGRRFLSASSFLVLLAAAHPAAAQLVFDGEEIADAKLLAAAKQEGKLTLYGTIPSESMAVTLDAFKAETGVQPEYIRLPTARMYDRVNAEFDAKKLEADYIGMTDLTLVKTWATRGLLASYKTPSFTQLPSELRDTEGQWYYVVRPITVIAVNTAMVKEGDAPKSWKDLFDPKWKGKIGMPSMDAGGSALTLYAFLRMKIAPDAWQKLAANEPRIYPSAAPTVADLTRGRTAVAISGASSYAEQIENGAPLKIVFPTDGLASFGEIGNVTVTAPHPNAARLYMNYITSKHGSATVAKQGSYGTHPGAPAPSKAGYTFPPPSQVWTIRIEDWEKYQDTWPKEWKAIFEK